MVKQTLKLGFLSFVPNCCSWQKNARQCRPNTGERGILCPQSEQTRHFLPFLSYFLSCPDSWFMLSPSLLSLVFSFIFSRATTAGLVFSKKEKERLWNLGWVEPLAMDQEKCIFLLPRLVLAWSMFSVIGQEKKTVAFMTILSLRLHYDKKNRFRA